MRNLKNFILGHKKIVIVIIVLVFCVGLGGYLFFGQKTTTNNQESESKVIENTYTMYVKINPLVKLTFKEVYTECVNDDGTKSICGGIEETVVNYELINDDAKEIYKELDFKNKSVLDVLVMLCDTARENNIGFEKLEITSDWDKVYNEKEINNALNESGNYEYELNVFVDFTEYPENSEILEEVKKYTVTFDANGGNIIESQKVLENSKVLKPGSPTREGYKFIEWQLNKKTYDFESAVTSDITLKAKWEKELEKENNATNENSKPEENTQIPSENTKEEAELEKEPEKDEYQTSSTIDKINLNDNLLVYEWNGGGTICGGYFFATNTSEVFGTHLDGKRIEDPLLEEAGIYPSTLYNELEYDTAKETLAVSKLEEIKNIKGFGYKEFEYWNMEHSIGYRFDRLELAQDYGKLNKEWQNKQLSYEDKIDAVFTGAYYSLNGYCGIGPEEEALLTEELCNKYNLTCARW